MEKEFQEKEVLTVKDVQKYLEISRNLAYALWRQSDFPGVVAGRRKLLSRKAFLRWLREFNN